MLKYLLSKLLVLFSDIFDLFLPSYSWNCKLLASLQRAVVSEPNIPLCCGIVSEDVLLEECYAT